MATTQNGIYYQDDYTKSADILADMKEMAESIDGVIEEEKEITEQTIQQIQEAQTAQNQKIEQLEDNQIHITTEKSSNLNIKDASGQNAKINVFGISKQETRSGKNKLKLTNQNYTNAGLNWEATETEVKINGTATGTYSQSNLFECDIKAGTYKFLAGGNSGFVYRIWLYNTANEMIKYTTSGEQFTITEDIVKYQLIFDNITVGNTYNTTFKPMILEATEQDETFEQYGASPSPEYPSEIQNTTGNVKITSCNKNLWNDDSWNIRDVIDGKNVLKFSGYYVSGTGVKNGNPLTFPNKFKKGVTYTVSGKFKKTTYDNQLCIMYKDFSIQYGGKFADNFEKSSVSITTSSEKEVLYFTIFSGSSLSNSYVEEGSLQLEENSIATEYIEHQQQTITFPLQENQKMYKGSETKDDGIHHKRKQKELDGTENWMVLGNNYYLAITDKKLRYEPTKGKMLCTHFKETQGVGTAEIQLNEFFEAYYTTGNYNVFFNYDNGAGGVDNWKSYLSQQKQAGTPVIVEYELATEEIEAYTEEQQTVHNQPQNAKTYKTVTNVFTENAEVEMEYIAHTKTYIDNKYNALAQQILEIAGGN